MLMVKARTAHSLISVHAPKFENGSWSSNPKTSVHSENSIERSTELGTHSASGRDPYCRWNVTPTSEYRTTIARPITHIIDRLLY